MASPSNRYPLERLFGSVLSPFERFLRRTTTGPTVSGWGIPMATDIAFALGILVLLAWRIPLFSFANASIDFSTARISELMVHAVTIGVFFGLVGGKFLGIGCTSWLAVVLGLARLPDGVGWRHVFGVAWLGGIGFTMSLFISQLAFGASPELMEDAKFGILAASAVSGVVGLIWLYISASRDGSSSTKP